MKSGSITLLAAGALALSTVTSAHAATIMQDFESLTVGTSSAPSGWSYVNINNGNNAYVTVTGNGGGVGAQITGDNNTNANQPPGSYLVNSGGNAFDVTQSITGSFDYYITTNQRALGGIFFFGDIKTGLPGTSAGGYIGMQMMQDSFGNRGGVILGHGSQVASFSGNQNGQQWYNISFSWTPTSGTTGNFSASGTGPTKSWTVSYNGYTFDSAQAYFGFGAGDYYNTSGVVVYDNISITGTEYVIPEPMSLAAMGLGGLLVLGKRRKA
ncbi:MAG: PEP-CTERM sorting domain-containing protein [Phycisphaera sp.]|nr:PEP-CTERM sorting domain-containing protein [Phycisphaera sp.]